MKADGDVGSTLQVHCARHPSSSVSVAHPSQFPTSLCGRACEHRFPCDHPCPKQCHALEDHGACQVMVEATLSCGHTSRFKCGESSSLCRLPCPRKLKCGHACPYRCGEECPPFNPNCADCEHEANETRKAEMEANRKAIEERQQKIDALLKQKIDELTKKRQPAMTLTELPEDDLDYRQVKSQVEASVSPRHMVVLSVQKIQRITNLELELNHLEAQKEMVDPQNPPVRLFHGTSKDIAKKIAMNGFLLPPLGKRNMFGRGIYFANNSSKSAQDMYTKVTDSSSRFLILADVSLGSRREVIAADPDAHLPEKRAALSYDSIYAKPGSQASGGVIHDEEVIFDPRLAIPRFIIELVSIRPRLPVSPSSSPGVPRVVEPSSSWNTTNPDQVLFRMVESQFQRQSQTTEKVKKIEVWDTPELQSKFEEVKLSLRATEDDVELVFHGTAPENINKIMRGGFKIGGDEVGVSSGAAYGRGVYVALVPAIAKGYARGKKVLIAAELLKGPKKKRGSRVIGHNPAMSDALVIHDKRQLWPRFVVEFV